jgi:hypothetical protein
MTDFATRRALGFRSFGFDSLDDMGQSDDGTKVSHGYQFQDSAVEGIRPHIDFDVSAEPGGGSIRMDIPARMGVDPYYAPWADNAWVGGNWFCNFSPTLDRRYGANTSFYVQWRMRFNDAWMNSYIYAADPLRYSVVTITGISKTNPAVVTYTGTVDPQTGVSITPEAGARVALAVKGMTELDGNVYVVGSVDAVNKTFTLQGVDATAYGTFTSGMFQHLIDQSGLKFMDISVGDTPTSRFYNSCEDITVVTQTPGQWRMPHAYHSCNGDGALIRKAEPFDEFNETIQDYMLQNMRYPCGLPPESWDQRPNTIPGVKNGVDVGTACLRCYPNEWMTFQIGIDVGPRETTGGQDHWLNSRIRMWAAREGQPQELWLDWNPGIANYFPLYAGDPAEDLRYGKIWLFPYTTYKSQLQAHETMRVWYDELIISEVFLPDPPNAAPYRGPLVGAEARDTTVWIGNVADAEVGRVAIRDRAIIRGSVSGEAAADPGWPTGIIVANESRDSFSATDGSLPAWVTNIPVFSVANILRDDGTFNRFVDGETAAQPGPNPCPSQTCTYSGSAGNADEYAFSGNVYASHLGQYGSLLVSAGGHDGYYGNEVYRYDVATREWSLLTQPHAQLFEAPGGALVDSVNGESWADGTFTTTLPDQPGAYHSYRTQIYLPPGVGGAGANGAFLTPGRIAMSRNGGAGLRSHILDLAGSPLVWQRFSLNTTQDRGYFTTCLDTVRGKVYMLDEQYDLWAQIRVLDLQTRMWGWLPLNNAIRQTNGSPLAYSPSLNRIIRVAFDPNVNFTSITLIEPDSGSVTLLTASGQCPTTTNDRVIIGGNFGGGEWVESLGCLYYYMGDKSSTLYKLTPPAVNPTSSPWSWSPVTFGGVEPAEQYGTTEALPHYGRLHYVDGLGIFLWHGSGTAPVQAWRIS